MDGYSIMAAAVGCTIIALIIGVWIFEHVWGSRAAPQQRSLFKSKSHRV